MKVTLVLEGHPTLVNNLQRLNTTITRQGNLSAWNGAQHLYARTHAVVPYLTGELYEHAFMANIGQPKKPTWIVGYDTVAVPHAVIVHEVPNRNHPTRGPSSEPKQDHFLSEPRDQMEKSYPKDVERDMRQAITKTRFLRTPRKGR